MDDLFSDLNVLLECPICTEHFQDPIIIVSFEGFGETLGGMAAIFVNVMGNEISYQSELEEFRKEAEALKKQKSTTENRHLNQHTQTEEINHFENNKKKIIFSLVRF